ncbi:7814_t:CDS:2, partial [Acaulospora colombiana]
MSGNIVRSPERIDKKVLVDLMKDKSKVPGVDYLVVDVRDDDYVSQIRGPKCARKYYERLSARDIASNTKIHILKGGFHEWQYNYKDDPELVKDYDYEYS